MGGSDQKTVDIVSSFQFQQNMGRYHLT